MWDIVYQTTYGTLFMYVHVVDLYYRVIICLCPQDQATPRYLYSYCITRTCIHTQTRRISKTHHTNNLYSHSHTILIFDIRQLANWPYSNDDHTFLASCTEVTNQPTRMCGQFWQRYTQLLLQTGQGMRSPSAHKTTVPWARLDFKNSNTTQPTIFPIFLPPQQIYPSKETIKYGTAVFSSSFCVLLLISWPRLTA